MGARICRGAFRHCEWRLSRARQRPAAGLAARQARRCAVQGRAQADARRGRGLCLSIHQLADAARLCDRLVLLADGRTAGEGTLAELRARAGLAAGDASDIEDVFLALTWRRARGGARPQGRARAARVALVRATEPSSSCPVYGVPRDRYKVPHPPPGGTLPDDEVAFRPSGVPRPRSKVGEPTPEGCSVRANAGNFRAVVSGMVFRVP